MQTHVAVTKRDSDFCGSYLQKMAWDIYPHDECSSPFCKCECENEKNTVSII